MAYFLKIGGIDKMLNLLYGPAWSGKSTQLRRHMAQCAAVGRQALLLVPEQASFINEKKLAQMPATASLVSVASFSRLAELLELNFGGDDRAGLDPAAAFLMMGVTLDELSDELTVYRRHAKSRGFLEQMTAVADECRYAGVEPGRLAAFALSQPQGSAKEKLYELSLILDAYDAVLHRSFISLSDRLERAAERLNGSGYFAHTEVFVDDFTSFTAPELVLLETILREAPRMTVSLCTDAPDSASPAFAVTGETVRALTRAAERVGVTVVFEAATGGESELPRGLLALEKAQRDETQPSETTGDDAVTVMLATTPSAELEQTAAAIARLVREKGFRYREIVVMARDLARYRTLLPTLFARYEIPFFLDLRADAKSGVLTAAVLEAVSLAGGLGGDYLALAKSPLLGLDAQTAGELENYCFVWSVRPSGWHTPFVNHPDGLLDGQSTEASARLARVEQARQAVVNPLLSLERALQAGGGEMIARGLWTYLQEISATEHLGAFAGEMEGDARQRFLDEQSQVWEQLVKILERFAALPDGLRLTPRRTAELAELMLGSIEVATPPLALDEVSVGDALRMRPDNPKVVFLLGAVEGEFPSAPSIGGLLSERERRRLVQGGFPLMGGVERFVMQERILCYRAVTSAHEHLFVSYPVTEETGEPLQPSALYLRARALARPTALPTMPLVQTAASAERALAILAGSDTPYTATLRALCERVLPSGRVARIERAACRIPHHLAQREVARRLFGKRLRLSPSRLERYYQCPFSYFIQDGLGLRALRKAELSPLETGTLVHRVLERMVSSHGGKGLSSLSEEDIRVEITQETDAYLAERLIDSGALTRRMRYAFAQLGDWLVELIVRLGKEFSQSEFEPVAFEMPIRAGAEVTPLVLQTVDGGEVLVEGTVDRVDVAMVNGERYVRVVDYKSGGKSFRLTDVYYGLNMQMLVYLFSIWKNGQGALSGLLPAGILYLPALGRYHTASRADAPEKVEKECQKHYRMNGLLLSDPQVLHAMEADGKGVFLPVRAGQEKSDALATLAEMGKLCRLVEKRVRDVARLLADGEIPARPVRRKNENPCTRCDWHGVCGFEEGDETRELIELDRDQLWKEEDDV